MASRVERAAPIFSRITGLIRAGQMKWQDRPLWYDVYAAVPPFEEPVWDLKMPKADEPLKQLIYEEDFIRAKFYTRFPNAGIIQIESNKPSVCQLFVQQYETEMKENPDLSEDAVFEKTVNVLKENGILRSK